jgi:drug/metabolite transporter (DMT)-like permease
MTLPIFTAVGAFLCFGETFHAHEFIGAMVTLFAIWRVAAAKKQVMPERSDSC